MSRYSDPQIELNLPDEERRFELAIWNFRCVCGHAAILERNSGQFRVSYAALLNLTPGNWGHHDFKQEHSEPTPWLASSQQAIQHWKLVAVLSRP